MAFSTLKLDDKQQANLFSKMGKARNKWIEFVQICFLSKDFKEKYIEIMNERFERIAK